MSAETEEQFTGKKMYMTQKLELVNLLITQPMDFVMTVVQSIFPFNLLTSRLICKNIKILKKNCYHSMTTWDFWLTTISGEED